MRFWGWIQSLLQFFLFFDILLVQLSSMDVAQAPQPKNFLRAVITGQSWVPHQFFSIFGHFCPILDIFGPFLTHNCSKQCYNHLHILNLKQLDDLRENQNLYFTFYTKFLPFQAHFGRIQGVIWTLSWPNSLYFWTLIAQNVHKIGGFTKISILLSQNFTLIERFLDFL